MSAAEQLLADNNVKISELIKEVQRWRDASAGLNSIYPTVTEGRQSVADGKYFSVPGNGAYMRLYRRQGSSASLIAEFPDRDELNGVITQLGPLLGRGVVGGSGDLMAQGYNGWGGAINYGSTSDFLTLPFGAIGNEGQSSIPANAPLEGNNRYAGLKLGNANTELMFLAASLTAGRPIYASVKSSSGWDGYRRILSDRDVLGTVSQSDGVPTGAIIERGANANGEYVKFADGTLINSKQGSAPAVDSLVGGLYRSGIFTTNWAHSFNNSNYAVFGGVQESVSSPQGVVSRTHGAGSAGLFFWSAAQKSESGSYQLSAIGRWY